MNTSITQKGIKAGGKVVGQDDNSVHIENAFIGAGKTISRLKKLLASFWHEYSNNIQFKNEVDELQYYKDQVDSGPIEGLEAKLIAGGRGGAVAEATKKKEIFARKLSKLKYYKSAQLVFVYLLGRTEETFKSEIHPMIASGADRAEIDSAIMAKIVEPILDELEGDEMLTSYILPYGMLYYLTGNCHIKWHAP